MRSNIVGAFGFVALLAVPVAQIHAQTLGPKYKLGSYNAAEVLSLVEKGLEASHRGGVRFDVNSVCAIRIAVLKESRNPAYQDHLNNKVNCHTLSLGWEYAVALYGTFLEYRPEYYKMGKSDVCVIAGMADTFYTSLGKLDPNVSKNYSARLDVLQARCEKILGPPTDALEIDVLEEYIDALAGQHLAAFR